MTNSTRSIKPSEVTHEWLLFDAENVVLGRLAAEVAKLLRGKHKPSYTPHIDCGDNIIIVNAEKVHLTGRKRERKEYYKHTGYPGGIKQTTPEKILEGEHPERVIELAVQRMLPNNKLARRQIKKLRIYAGPEHPHDSEKPTKVDFAAQNDKNVKRK